HTARADRAVAESVVVSVGVPDAEEAHRRIGVVAVVVVVDVATGGFARRLRHGGISEAVPVGVGVERADIGGCIVDQAVAVVVRPVAPLDGVRVHGGVRVVAVGVLVVPVPVGV